MKNDIFKIMILHKDKVVRKTIKDEILKVLPHTLFLTASTKNSFYKKIEWMTPDLVLSNVAKSDMLGLEALLYVRKNLSGIPFIFLINQFQERNNSLSTILKEANGTINYIKLDQVAQIINDILPEIKRYKNLKKAEQFQLHQQVLLAQKSIALSTKGYLIPKQEIYLKYLGNR